MGDSDEIRPGDRFERVVDSFLGHVVKWGVYTALAKESVTEGHDGWSIEELSRDHIFYGLSDAAIWRRLPRTDAPAAKVGDVVKDPALLADGMRVKELASDWEATLEPGSVPNRPGPHWRADSSGPGYPGIVEAIWHDSIRESGVRILALPEPPKAEAQCRRDPDCVRVDGHTTMCTTGTNRPPLPPKAEPAIVPPPPRCKPGCTPREPCRTEGVCPVFAEERIEDVMGRWDGFGAERVNRGISPDALPPARASATYQPRCAELAGYGSWNGREGK